MSPTSKKVTWNSSNKVKFRKITLIEVNFKIGYVQDILTLESFVTVLFTTNKEYISVNVLKIM